MSSSQYFRLLCWYKLTATNTSFGDLAYTPMQLDLRNCKVEKAEVLSERAHISLENTSVSKLRVFGALAFIADSNINETSISTQVAIVKNSKLERVKALRSQVIRLIDTKIDRVEKRAIVVFRDTTFKFVSINYLDRYSIILRDGARLNMMNVTIEQGERESFNFTSDSMITFEKVTMNGSPLKAIEKIKVDNKGIKTTITIPAPVTKPSSTTVSSAIASTPQSDKTDSGPVPGTRIVTSVVIKTVTEIVEVNPKVGDAPTPSWVKWAGKGAVIFLMLCAVLLIVSVALVKK